MSWCRTQASNSSSPQRFGPILEVRLPLPLVPKMHIAERSLFLACNLICRSVSQVSSLSQAVIMAMSSAVSSSSLSPPLLLGAGSNTSRPSTRSPSPARRGLGLRSVPQYSRRTVKNYEAKKRVVARSLPPQAAVRPPGSVLRGSFWRETVVLVPNDIRYGRYTNSRIPGLASSGLFSSSRAGVSFQKSSRPHSHSVNQHTHTHKAQTNTHGWREHANFISVSRSRSFPRTHVVVKRQVPPTFQLVSCSHSSKVGVVWRLVHLLPLFQFDLAVHPPHYWQE